MVVVNSFKSKLIKLIYLVRKKTCKTKKITYYPKFNTGKDISNHYFRASWYLPEVNEVLKKINFFINDEIEEDIKVPSCFSQTKYSTEHLKIIKWRIRYFYEILSSDAVLLWDSSKERSRVKLLKWFGIHIINVDSSCLKSKEYGVYPSIIWHYLLSDKAKSTILANQHAKFLQSKIHVDKLNKKCSTVFGTGPSIDDAYKFDFSNSVNIVCNSIVQNSELLEHINPDYITAGDAVSHIGISLYADTFRKDLLNALETRDLYYFGTIEIGYILLLHYPELSNKIILISQRTNGPVYDLTQCFISPRLASTMNIHMLPLAATFSDSIFILGADGKNPVKSKNEDFWAHSKSAQYHSLVESGHLCHPTFDLHRQVDTYDKYIDSTKRTIEIGELKFKKSYVSLAPSFVEPLSKRFFRDYKALDSSLLTNSQIDVSELIVDEFRTPVVSFDVSNSDHYVYISSCSLSNDFVNIKGGASNNTASSKIIFLIDGDLVYEFHDEIDSIVPDHGRYHRSFSFNIPLNSNFYKGDIKLEIKTQHCRTCSVINIS